MSFPFVSHSTAGDNDVAEMEPFLRAVGLHEVRNDITAVLRLLRDAWVGMRKVHAVTGSDTCTVPMRHDGRVLESEVILGDERRFWRVAQSRCR